MIDFRMRRAVGLAMMIVVLSSTSGCGLWNRWWGKSPSSTSPTSTSPSSTSIGPPEGPAPRPIAEARAACANYDRVITVQPYPRDAYLRGILTGKATIRFTVTGSRIDLSRVTSTDSAFADAAVDRVRKLDCRVVEPTVFEIPFVYARGG